MGNMKNFRDYITIKEASELLGVSTKTLRRWDFQGKVKSIRHPINSYRLYRRGQLEKILRSLNRK